MKKVACLFSAILVFASHSIAQVNPDKGSGSTMANSDSNGSANQKSMLNNITFLNAANFDFTDKLDASYLGKLNIFAPNIAGTPFGFNAGIMKIKFNYKDSSHPFYLLENQLIHPLDSIKNGTKYLRQLNKYTITRSNNVWSFYAQPMFRIVSWPKKGQRLKDPITNGIYLHAHAELLVNKTNVTTTIEDIQQDTALMDTSKHLSYKLFSNSPIIDDKTYLNGYFDLGVTCYLDPFSNGNSRFFFQPTIGITTNYPNWTDQDITSTTSTPTLIERGAALTRSGDIPSYRTVNSKWFYLVRAEFMQTLSDNSQIIIGTDIRGLFPKFNPLYAAYVGLNVNFDALASIFSDKHKSSNNSDSNNSSTKPTDK